MISALNKNYVKTAFRILKMNKKNKESGMEKMKSNRKGNVIMKSIKFVIAVVFMLTFSAGFIFAQQLTIPNTFTAGTTISSSQMNANFTAIQNAVDPLQVSNYWQFGGLNYARSTVTTTWTQLGIASSPSLSFTKSVAASNIEVYVNSNFYAGVFAGGANGIAFQVGIDGIVGPTFGNTASILTTGATEFLSIYSIFQGLAAGPHTVSLWAETSAGSSTSVLVDPGGWGGAIIVKESGI